MTTMAAGLALLDAWTQPRTLAFDRIPVIDFQEFRDGSDRQGVAERIGQACREIGFLYLTNHGIPQALVDAAMAQARRFFAQPMDAKMRLDIAASPAHRGYFPFFAENNDPQHHRDLKEGFDLARHLSADHPLVRAGKPLHGPNVWPDDLPGFRDTIEEYYAALTELAVVLMDAFALSLRLPADYFRPMLDEAMGGLRLLHYPPQPAAASDAGPGVVGTGAHTDYGCLTILAQDANGGLQVQNAAGDWVSAPPVPGAFVINLGDQMARWTNDVFAATRHRVLNLSGHERYSMPFFFEPNYDAVIGCLDSCRSPAHPPKYPDVVAGDYLLSRLNDTFTHRTAETTA